MPLNGFISYTRADAVAARTIHRDLRRLARRWWKPYALDLFLDETHLAAGGSLPKLLSEAATRAEHFILVASPEVAERRWVRLELALWCRAHRGRAPLLAWVAGPGDSPWETSAPKSLRRLSAAQPLWVDFRGAVASGDLTRRNPQYFDALIKLGAALHGVRPEVLHSEDLRRARTARRLAVAAVGILAFLCVVVGTFAAISRRAARVAKGRQLAFAAEAMRNGQANASTDAVALALLATRTWETPEAVRSLRTCLAGASRGRVTDWSRWERVVGVDYDSSGSLAAIAARENEVSVWNRSTQTVDRTWLTDDRVWDVVISRDGTSVAAGGSRGVVSVWNVETGRQTGAHRTGSLVASLAWLDGPSRGLVAACGDGHVRIFGGSSESSSEWPSESEGVSYAGAWGVAAVRNRGRLSIPRHGWMTGRGSPMFPFPPDPSGWGAIPGEKMRNLSTRS